MAAAAAAGGMEVEGRAFCFLPLVGRCSLTVSTAVLKAPMVSAVELKLQRDERLSNFAFQLNLRRYTLPVRTGLPVHVNAYFELSSNRRDIWFGGDMAGVLQADTIKTRVECAFGFKNPC